MVHVGLMVLGLGLSSSCASASSFVQSIGLSHLLSHSFSKASLFM